MEHSDLSEHERQGAVERFSDPDAVPGNSQITNNNNRV
jgi:hypothetical protein